MNEMADFSNDVATTIILVPETDLSNRPNCPRCGALDEERRFYGPCESCRNELGETMRLAPKDVKVEAYVPKMNVVANHVATKD